MEQQPLARVAQLAATKDKRTFDAARSALHRPELNSFIAFNFFHAPNPREKLL